jgi:hypothetical protein
MRKMPEPSHARSRAASHLTIISGGQTGVDRAALAVARERGLDHGGWCPRARKAEDGAVPRRYPLRPTPLPRYAQRTTWNVRDSDATLLLHTGRLRGGSALTARVARAAGRSCLVVNLARPGAARHARCWLAERAAQGLRRLNVAGPRESESRGIGRRAQRMLRGILAFSSRSASSRARR